MAPKPPTAEMKAVMDYMAREDAGLPNPLTLDAPAGRELAVLRNRRWQVDQPPMARVADYMLPPDVSLRTPPVRIKVFVPEGAGSGILLVVHGGGWANGSTETHERVMRLLALSSKAAVVGLNYRLAPENPYPAGLDDVVALFRALQATPSTFGLAAGPIVVTGDSAGANLAICATLREQAEGRPAPAGAVLH
jgi:acetyl esterase